MRTLRYALLALATLGTVASVAYAAGRPESSYTYWSANIPVSDCVVELERAIEAETGSSAVVTVEDAYNYRVRASTSTTTIFGYCSALSSTVCGQPKARVNVVAFSENGSSGAANLRRDVREAFGDPVIIDCGVIKNPL